MNISGVSASATTGGSNQSSIKQLEDQKKELDNDIKAVLASKDEKTRQAKLQALQSRLNLIEMKLSLEQSKGQKQTPPERQVRPSQNQVPESSDVDLVA